MANPVSLDDFKKAREQLMKATKGSAPIVRDVKADIAAADTIAPAPAPAPASKVGDWLSSGGNAAEGSRTRICHRRGEISRQSV